MNKASLCVCMVILLVVTGCGSSGLDAAKQKALDLANTIPQDQIISAKKNVPLAHLKPLGIQEFTCSRESRGYDFQQVAGNNKFYPSILQRCSVVVDRTIYNFSCELYPGREGCSSFDSTIAQQSPSNEAITDVQVTPLPKAGVTFDGKPGVTVAPGVVLDAEGKIKPGF